MEKENSSGSATQPTFVERLAEKLGMAANSSTIYGEAVERNGVTVIPVSKAMYGFGGGTGAKPDGEGSGAGGGIAIIPVGYIEMKEGNTRFRTIRDPQTIIKIVAIGGLTTLLIARSITGIFKK
ncbi:spore germination protein GerW family protein [Pontibacter silvestris]|uniref:Spore germination protein GerW family protein n=1 Tax=Pontibacter silvestris TaxID=2305183 RepID=A0ABW4WX31_9BACT|nr:spore germination protein GerW family protein [Pontibacter silvestris]MCC9136768.1 hypothetical protein [Pontibacter silvestris]